MHRSDRQLHRARRHRAGAPYPPPPGVSITDRFSAATVTESHPGFEVINRAVGPVRLRPGDLTPEHRDLMTEHHDLRVLGRLAAAEQHEPAKHPDDPCPSLQPRRPACSDLKEVPITVPAVETMIVRAGAAGSSPRRGTSEPGIACFRLADAGSPALVVNDHCANGGQGRRRTSGSGGRTAGEQLSAGEPSCAGCGPAPPVWRGSSRHEHPELAAWTSQSSRREAFRQSGRRVPSRRSWPSGAETSSTFGQRPTAASRPVGT
jgi:hypothetical protein